ncbi:MAG: rhomboid family intramembrane serine protease [Rhodobacteraceae bacterium]|nr:rhomboid family intramembrane serine protease [Paracoccaceae bacterium]
MFPIRDHNPSGRTPFVTYGLIAANIAIFLWYWPLFNDPRAIDLFFSTWGMVPLRLAHAEGGTTLITSMFLHGGVMHLAGNMLFLWIFGDNLEDQLGHVGFGFFYLGSGIAAALAQFAAEPASMAPMVGASGAIAGVMGGYLLLFPRARIDVLIIIVIFFRVFTLPAWIILGVWFALQLFSGVTQAGAGVAFWAHVGGFVAGLMLAFGPWLRRGGIKFWQKTKGLPPHAATRYRVVRSSFPVIRRR